VDGLSLASADLLERLRDAHREVFECMAEMERITEESAPDVQRYTAARLRISQASLKRRSLWQKARSHLEGRIGDSTDLKLLGSNDSELGFYSTNHISRWTVAAIQSDWTGYRDASRRMRRRMSDCIRTEQRLLYALLARRS